MDDGSKHRHFRLSVNLTFSEPLTGSEMAARVKAALDSLPKGNADWYFNATDAPIPDGFDHALFGPDHMKVGQS